MEKKVDKNKKGKQETEDGLKQVESLAAPLANEISKLGRDSIALPSMPREAVIKSIENKKYAKIRFIVKGKSDEDNDPKIPILQHNHKFEGIDAEGRKVKITMKLKLKKNDKVLIAYKDGELGSPVIIGKLP